MMTELDMWAGGPQLILFPSEMTLAEINENGAKKWEDSNSMIQIIKHN